MTFLKGILKASGLIFGLTAFLSLMLLIAGVRLQQTLHTGDWAMFLAGAILALGSAFYFFSHKHMISERLAARHAEERKRTESLLGQAQRMEAIGRMSGGVAHDFNNLLIVISGNLELLRRRVRENEELVEMIDDALNSVDRGRELTQRMLAFSRKQILKPDTLDLTVTLPGIINLIRRALPDNMTIEYHLAGDIWKIDIDPAQLENALLNLAANAGEAAGGLGGRIIIETRNITFGNKEDSENIRPGSYVALSMSDNGAGIPAENLEHVFDPFFSTKNTESSGLGLSMVYGFVRQSGGFVDIESTLGQGTTVTLYFPRAAGDARQNDVQAKAQSPSGNNMSVLLVDDRPDVLRYLTTTLREMGYRVTPAKDGIAALKKIETRKKLDLLITDVVMPGMNGEQLAHQVLKKFPTVKILFISGYTRDALIEKGTLKKGVNLLQKPFTRNDLAHHIHLALNDKAAA